MRTAVILVCTMLLAGGSWGPVLAGTDHATPHGSNSEVRIFAAYFPYGRGIAEGFAYHPGEQTQGRTGDPNSEKLAAIFYGNKFVHVTEGLAPGANPNALQTRSFLPGTLIVPMDDKQADIVLAFGFLHALLRNNTWIYRVIEPPDITIRTQNHPAGDIFRGGPIMVLPKDTQTFMQVHQSFQSVSYDNLTREFMSNRVFIVGKPTSILLIKGSSNWGETELLLDKMKIPYDMTSTTSVNANPDILFSYDLAIDDCGGWDTEYGGSIPNGVLVKMREFVSHGGEMIYTDRAMGELERAFPNHIPVGTYGPTAVWDVNMVNVPEFPGQYYGNPTVKMYQLGSGADMLLPVSSDVRLMAYQSPSGPTPTITLTAPNGGALTAGSQASITWTAAGGTPPLSIDLELSVSGPTGPWVTISKGLSNTGTYQWSVPYVPTNEGYIRATVRDSYWRTASAVNTQAFSINAPQLRLDVGASADDYTLASGTNATVSVRVQDAFGVVEGANVTLTSTVGGSFNPASGKTDSIGYFRSVFTAPSTASLLRGSITARATAPGYIDGSDAFDIIVDPVGQQALDVQVKLNPPFLHSGDVGYVSVRVTDGSTPVAGASLSMAATDGMVTPASDTTNATGEALFAYTPPTTPIPRMVSVVANATLSGYLDGTGEATAVLNPLLDLRLNSSAQKTTLYANERSKIHVHVDSNSYDISGSTVEFRVSGRGSLSASTATTNTTGDAEVEFIAPPTVPSKESPVVFIRAVKPGYTTALDSVFFTLMPDPVLEVKVTPGQTLLNSSESTPVDINVSYLGSPVPNATVDLTVSAGRISPASGSTNASGRMGAVYTAPAVTSQISVDIEANASMTGFKDGYGRASVTVLPLPRLTVKVVSNVSTMKSGDTASVTVTVSESSLPVANASVYVNATSGSITPSSGKTDPGGTFRTTFTAPSVNASTPVTITANASAAGYASGSGQTYITVEPPGGSSAITVSFTASPTSLRGGETSALTVSAYSGSAPLEGADVLISADDGYVDPSTGKTDRGGAFTAVFTAPDVTAAKSVTLTAEVSMSGYTSGRETVVVQVEPWTGERKSMHLTLTPERVETAPLGKVSLTAVVKEGLVPLKDVRVRFTYDDGAVTPASGLTDDLGEVQTVFTAPNTSARQVIRVTATATRAGYIPTAVSVNITVVPGGEQSEPPSGAGVSTGTIALAGFAAGAGVFLLLVVYFLRGKRCPACRQRIPRGATRCPGCTPVSPWQQGPAR